MGKWEKLVANVKIFPTLAFQIGQSIFLFRRETTGAEIFIKSVDSARTFLYPFK